MKKQFQDEPELSVTKSGPNDARAQGPVLEIPLHWLRVKFIRGTMYLDDSDDFRRYKGH